MSNIGSPLFLDLANKKKIWEIIKLFRVNAKGLDNLSQWPHSIEQGPQPPVHEPAPIHNAPETGSHKWVEPHLYTWDAGTVYNHTSSLICRKTSFHSLCCWKGWGPLVYVTAEHSLSTLHNWIHTTPLLCGQRKSKISPLLLLSNPYLPMPRIMQDDSRIWVVAKENGHKCGDEFMPQSMPRSVDL